MSLVTYEETRPYAKAIKAKVAAREMPPWFIDKNVGVQTFSNDVSLTDDEIETISKWVDGGAPQGNPADMPAARHFDDSQSWFIGQPDLIVTLPKDFIVNASGPDQWPDLLVDPHLTDDRYIKGVQIIPLKGFPVIHHIRTSIVQPVDATLHSGKLDSTDGVTVWIDDRRLDAGKPMTAALDKGLHHVVLQVDLSKRKTAELRALAEKPAGSTASYTIVGGK